METRNCQNCKKDFNIEPDDFSFYEKMKVPAPEICPQCRQQLRTLFRNFKTLYKRTSSKSGKPIISVYDQDAIFPVYSIDEWWADGWDPMTYGIDLDLAQSFFSQLTKLFNTVPHISLINVQSENCDFSNLVFQSKNCYLLFGAIEDEDCDYGHVVWNCRDSVDNLYTFKCESVYECIDCLGSTKLLFSQECESCVDSIGLFDCRNCLNCIGCVGQVNKSYCIFNKQVTKDEYAEFLSKYPLNNRASIDFILKERNVLRTKVPQRSFFGSHNNDVSGNHIYNAHNVKYSFDIKSGEDSKYCFTVRSAEDTYDTSFSGEATECYNNLNMMKANNTMGSHMINDSYNVYYSDNCHNCENIFGCYGLRKKSYCILNMQYTKEEYEKLFSKLIERMESDKEWGLFFPKELSPFAYNESIANEYMPLGKEEALAKCFRWKDEIPSTKGQGTIEYSKLPQNPEQYSDELIKEVLVCEDCKKNYRLINREINFYKKNKLLIPSRCSNCRHALRMSKRNLRDLWKGTCAKCGNDILTSYKPADQSKYKIYCEKCYQQEIY